MFPIQQEGVAKEPCSGGPKSVKRLAKQLAKQSAWKQFVIAKQRLSLSVLFQCREKRNVLVVGYVF